MLLLEANGAIICPLDEPDTREWTRTPFSRARQDISTSTHSLSSHGLCPFSPGTQPSFLVAPLTSVSLPINLLGKSRCILHRKTWKISSWLPQRPSPSQQQHEWSSRCEAATAPPDKGLMGTLSPPHVLSALRQATPDSDPMPRHGRGSPCQLLS